METQLIMPRIDFSKPTKLLLAQRVNYKCVYPGCDRVTNGPRRDLKRVISLGHAAHDAPASSGGPRSEEMLTPEQIRAYENGAWLCASDATLVDRDPRSFPLGTLPRWQHEAELRASNAVYLAPISTYAGTAEVCGRLEEFLVAARGISLVLYAHRRENTVVRRDDINKMWTLVKQCSGPNWHPNHPMHSLHGHTVAIQNQAISCLKSIYEEVTNRTRWTQNEYGDEYYLKRAGPPLRPTITQDQMDGLDHVYSCYQRYLDHLSDLRKYAKGEGHNIFSTF
jgi:hypothetical protein